MAMNLIFIAMAHQCDRTTFTEGLDQSQSKFLAVVLDYPISLVGRTAFHQFRSILPAKSGPGQFARCEGAKQLLTGTEVCHSDVAAGFGQTAPPESCDQHPQPIVTPVNRRINRFYSNHVCLIFPPPRSSGRRDANVPLHPPRGTRTVGVFVGALESRT